MLTVCTQTAEIIALLYEATQGPKFPGETPALNPTPGAQGRKPLDLDYQKDPSRPGGGIFVARGKARDGDYGDFPAGTVIPSLSDEESEGEVSAPTATYHANDRNRALLLSSMSSSSAFAPPLSTDLAGTQSKAKGASGSSPSLVNFTPLGGERRTTSGSTNNMNPAMNAQTVPSTQIINPLDMTGSLASVTDADIGFLEGIPGGMFDWGKLFLRSVSADVFDACSFSLGQWDTFFSRLNGGDMAAVLQKQQQQQSQQ